MKRLMSVLIAVMLMMAVIPGDTFSRTRPEYRPDYSDDHSWGGDQSTTLDVEINQSETKNYIDAAAVVPVNIFLGTFITDWWLGDYIRKQESRYTIYYLMPINQQDEGSRAGTTNSEGN